MIGESYRCYERNDNPLVFKTFDKAIKANPDAHPLFHSDRGVQYTNRKFHHKLEKQGMTQSMSRVAHCIDNGPMEGFWGILKREMYYGRRFTSKWELMRSIEAYMYSRHPNTDGETYLVCSCVKRPADESADQRNLIFFIVLLTGSISYFMRQPVL